MTVTQTRTRTCTACVKDKKKAQWSDVKCEYLVSSKTGARRRPWLGPGQRIASAPVCTATAVRHQCCTPPFSSLHHSMSAVSSPVNPATPPAPEVSSPASPCRAPVATCRLPFPPFKLLHCANFSCENWFHPKCVNIDEDKVDLLDVYICEVCEPLTSQRTRYKRFCKREGCERQAAPSSK